MNTENSKTPDRQNENTLEYSQALSMNQKIEEYLYQALSLQLEKEITKGSRINILIFPDYKIPKIFGEIKHVNFTAKFTCNNEDGFNLEVFLVNNLKYCCPVTMGNSHSINLTYEPTIEMISTVTEFRYRYRSDQDFYSCTDIPDQYKKYLDKMASLTSDCLEYLLNIHFMRELSAKLILDLNNTYER